jgi:hypothetical protein
MPVPLLSTLTVYLTGSLTALPDNTPAAMHSGTGALLARSSALRSRVLAAPIPTVPVQAPPGSAKILTIVGWVGWGVFIAAIVGVFAICIKMAINSHRNRMGDGGGEEAAKLFYPLLAVIIAGAVGAILGAVS